MGIFNSKNNVECPRCLGKKIVDQDDIKRLDLELFWLPGPCAYCEEEGKVSERLIAEFPADSLCFSLNISPEDRRKIRKHDQEAIDRAELFVKDMYCFVDEISYLYITGGMNSKQILEFCLIREASISDEETEELLKYIENVVKTKANKT